MVDYHNLEAQKYWSFPASFKGDKKRETLNMVYSGEYIGARKFDGAFYKFVKKADGTLELLGRSKGVGGDYLNKVEWVPQLNEFFKEVPNSSCFIGELVFPNNEGSNKVTSIMGCLKEKAIDRQRSNGYLTYYIFDVLQYGGVDYYTKNIEERVELLNALKSYYNYDYVKFASYFEGEELWNELQTILADGGEGIVITKKGTCYQPGKRPARQTLKIKKELQDTIDVFIMGSNEPTRLYSGKEIESWPYWENIITGEKFYDKNAYFNYQNGELIEPVTKPYFNEWAGSLKIGVNKDGKSHQIGNLSGLDEEILSNWRDYVGKVAEVTAMQITEDKALRHPRFVQWRSDKTPKECEWSQLDQ